ncbi:MAG: hypothetical protein IKU09_10705 [Firmicutes bacterium]|nr:hypothetical protein [Bacillota bacterium]
MAKHKHKKKSGQRIAYADSMAYVLEHPPAFKVDRNYEKEKARIEDKVTRTERKDWAWRQELMQIQSNQFIVDTLTGIMHDRSCPEGRNLPREQFSMIENYNASAKLCQVCREKAIIRQLTQWPEEYKAILTLLESCKIEFADLKRLQESKVSIRYITYNTLELQKGEDRWRIEKLDRDRFSLYHNSYILEDRRRRFTGKFHQEKISGSNDFHHIIMPILRYDSNFHIDKPLEVDRKSMDRAIELAPDNQLTRPMTSAEAFYMPTVRRVAKKGILFDYYMYVDCEEDYGLEAFRKRRIWSIRLYELAEGGSGYKLVFCKILKFQRSRIFSAMNEVKRQMYQKSYKDGYIVMQTARRYFAARGVKTAALKAPGKK